MIAKTKAMVASQSRSPMSDPELEWRMIVSIASFMVRTRCSWSRAIPNADRAHSFPRPAAAGEMRLCERKDELLATGQDLQVSQVISESLYEQKIC